MSTESAISSRQITFGPFRVLPEQHLVLSGDTPVRIGARALEILLALLEHPGEVVSKEALLRRVWPNIFVEESNLRVHIAALRKALGDGQSGRYITSVPGRGYCFVGQVALAADERPVPAAVEIDAVGALPASAVRLIGRDEVVATLPAQIAQHRLLTIVGAGGIGKTSVAAAVAESVRGQFRDGVRFIDLAPIADPSLVPSALAAVLGIAVHSERPTRSLVSFLRDKQMLILLDNCEHLIDSAAALADEIGRSAAATRVLATSREPLAIEGERVYRLLPLAVPPESDGLTAAQALGYSAVQLFTERAAMRLESFAVADSDAPLIADICRRLDGIALAIEIAAGRVDAFGVAGLAARLDDRFKLLLRGKRNAPARQQTLATTLDWSYALLPEAERVALRRLAVFAGSFTMDAAVLVVRDDPEHEAEIIDQIANLIEKSLVAVRLEGAVAEYRLLEIARAYALQKLVESGEHETICRRHAENYRDQLLAAGAEWCTEPATSWLARHRHLLGNVRAALDWSFSTAGDAALAVALTLGAEPLWFHLSLVSECCKRVHHALGLPAASRTPRDEMRLQTTLAWSLMQTKGSVAETYAAWSAALRSAEQLDDADHQLRAIWGIWAGRLNAGVFRETLALAERFLALAAARSSTADMHVGHRMVGYSLHLLGEQRSARHHLETMLAGYVPPVIGAEIVRFVFDQELTAKALLARALWILGLPDQARRLVEDAMAAAEASGDALSVCQVIVQAACPLALLAGDLARAERVVAKLARHASENAYEFWQVWARAFQAVLASRQDPEGGLRQLQAALDGLRAINYGVYYVWFVGQCAEVLAAIGETGEALPTIEQALARAVQNEEHWVMPELLRIKAELLGETRPGEAEILFGEALAVARRQGALWWELRAAVGLARLWRNHGRGDEARHLLGDVLARLNEGAETADMREARRVMDLPPAT